MIPVSQVDCITLEKVAYVIPNAVGIVSCGTKYVFGSLLSRKQTYKLLNRVLDRSRSSSAMLDDVDPMTPSLEDGNTDLKDDDDLNGQDPSSVTPLPEDIAMPLSDTPNLATVSSSYDTPRPTNRRLRSNGPTQKSHQNPSSIDGLSSSFLVLCFVLLSMSVLILLHTSSRIADIENKLAHSFLHRQYCTGQGCSSHNTLLQSLDNSAELLGQVGYSLFFSFHN